MRAGVGRAVLSATVLSACGTSAEPFRLELPLDSEPSAKSVIFEFESTGTKSDRLELIDLENLDPSTLDLPVVDPWDDSVTISSELAFYSAPSAVLGLKPGPLLRQPPGEGTAIEYLSTDSFLSAQSLTFLPDDEAASWKSEASLEGFTLRTTRIAFDRCVHWRPVNAKVPACRHTSFALASGPSTVIFGTHDQRFWEVDVHQPNQATPIASPLGLAMRPPASDEQCLREGGTATSTSIVALDQRVFSATGDPNTHAWYGGWGSVHYVAAGQAPITVDLPLAESVLYQRGIAWIDGRPDPEAADFEIYAMTSFGHVFRVSRVSGEFQAEEIFDFGLTDAAEVQVYGGIAYPGSGKLVAVHGSADKVLYYDHTLPAAQRAHGRNQPLPGQGHSAAAYVPAIGSLIAGEDARIFVHDQASNSWSPIEATDDWRSRIESIGSFGSGFVFGGTNGFMAQYLPGPGFCATEQLAPHTPQHIVELEDTVFAMGAKPGDKSEAVYSVLSYE